MSEISGCFEISWKNIAGILTTEFPEAGFVCSSQWLQAKRVLAAYPTSRDDRLRVLSRVASGVGGNQGTL
ncbi:MAG TPA: hypothetical protein IGS53_19255 [Leptolyngbyaceae cyanobacterium M33_DOE_097]|nr:hypothetical protein [Leptolyngbyaceae cyanobacterium M33_DOE_097]